MTYTPNMNALSHRKAAYKIEQRDIEQALRKLVAHQSGGYGADGVQTTPPDACRKTSFEGWRRGQIEFARRIARITAMHAARNRPKFTWKHRSVGLARRLALLVMVTTILMAQYI